jgi:hypothetical protein
MTVFLRGAGTALAEPTPSTNTTSFTLNHPAGLTAGDAIIVFTAASVFPNTTGSITYDWGSYEVVGDQEAVSGGNDYKLTVAFKIATSADVSAGSTTFNVTEVGSGTFFRARMLAYGGTSGLVGTPATLDHPLAGNGPSITVPVASRALFAVLTRTSSTVTTTPTSPAFTNDASIKGGTGTYSLGANMWGIDVDAGSTTTSNYAANESTDVRLSVAFALASADFPFPQVIFS